ncbi:MAG TPA: transposase, partial [Crenotrichaceae bacterium]|nr:transposase [Crenotrichaceae bacterium]
MMKRKRRTFTREFKLESAQLVIVQNYTVREAAEAMNVGKSTMDRWVQQLKQERNGSSSSANPFTPE